jgi:hypothetical protein
MNELAISYGQQVVRNPFSFHRRYVGVGLAPSRQLRLELKYLYHQWGSGWEYDDSRGWVLSCYCYLDRTLGKKP